MVESRKCVCGHTEKHHFNASGGFRCNRCGCLGFTLDVPAEVQEKVASSSGELASGSCDHQIADIQAEELPSEFDYWFDFQERVPEQSLFACTRSAAVLVQLCAILISTHVGLHVLRPGSTTCTWWLSLIVWFLSIFGGFYVLFPKRWSYRNDNILHMRSAYCVMVKEKLKGLWVSTGLCVLGLVIAALYWVGL